MVSADAYARVYLMAEDQCCTPGEALDRLIRRTFAFEEARAEVEQVEREDLRAGEAWARVTP